MLQNRSGGPYTCILRRTLFSRLPSISLSLHVIKIILDHTQRGRFVVKVISQIYKEALKRIYLVHHKILKAIDITLGSIYFKLAIIPPLTVSSSVYVLVTHSSNSCKLWLSGHLVHSVPFIYFSHWNYLCWLGHWFI